MRWGAQTLFFLCLLGVSSHFFWLNFTHVLYWSNPVSSHWAPSSSSSPRSSWPRNCWQRRKVCATAARSPSFLFVSTRSYWSLALLTHSSVSRAAWPTRSAARSHTQTWKPSFGNSGAREAGTEISVFQSEDRPLAVWWRSRSRWLAGRAVLAGDGACLRIKRFWGWRCLCWEVYARCRGCAKSKSHAQFASHSKVFSEISFRDQAILKNEHQNLISLAGMFSID